MALTLSSRKYLSGKFCFSFLYALCVASHKAYKWIKQHLHIKTFYGMSQNAVFTQIWIGICDYLLLIIALKMYHIEQNLYIFSDVIGQVLFERTPQNELFDKPIINQNPEDDRQLSLW